MQLGKAGADRVRKKKRWMFHLYNIFSKPMSDNVVWLIPQKMGSDCCFSCLCHCHPSQGLQVTLEMSLKHSQFFQTTELSFLLLLAFPSRLHQPGRRTAPQHYDNLVTQLLAQSWLPSHLPWALAREFLSALTLPGRFICNDLAWRSH